MMKTAVNASSGSKVTRRQFLTKTCTTAAGSLFPVAAETAKNPFDQIRTIGNRSPILPAQTLQIVSWNIDRGTNLSDITSSLQSCNADVLLLQEVDWNTARTSQTDVAAELCRRLNSNAVYGIEFEELSQERGGTPAYIGQATLCRLPILRSRVLRFRHQSNFWKPHAWMPSSLALMQRREGSRIALVTELQLANHRFVIYNAHLESRSVGPIQAAQIDEMLNDAAQYPAGTLVLLGGDLNTKYLPEYFLHKLERAGFRSALRSDIQRTHKIAMALDWLFIRGNAQWSQGQVDRSLRGSDHYPVRASLTLT